MNTFAKWLPVAALSAVAIPAYADDYSVSFTDTCGMGVNGTGTFSYSPRSPRVASRCSSAASLLYGDVDRPVGQPRGTFRPPAQQI
jgi:hypothetical protein